jgi:integrase
MAGRTNHRGFGWVRRLPSKAYQASYVGPDTLRHRAPSTFTAKIDAEGWLRDEKRLIENDEWTPPADRQARSRSATVTFDEYAAAWLTNRTLKPRTRAHYGRLLERLLVPHFGGAPVSAITPHRVRTWHAGLGTDTPTQRAHAYGLLRTILADAVRDGEIVVNPCHIRGAGNSRRVHKIKPATLAELEVLVAAMPERLRVMVLLASWCGLRLGELTELRRKDVSVDDEVLHVRRAVVRVDGGFVVGTPKSDAGTRDVAIPPHLMQAVEDHLDLHVRRGAEALLFPAANADNHLQPATLYRHYYKARTAAGRPDLRFHDLRHTGAVLAASTGATLAELMARLGHSTAGAALRYQHAAKDRDRVIAAALSELAAPAASDTRKGQGHQEPDPTASLVASTGR